MHTESYVVTGAARGVGRAIVERLAAAGHAVVALDLDPDALEWVNAHPRAHHLVAVAGDASDADAVSAAATRAEQLAPLAGWVNNAAIFRDAALESVPAGDVVALIARNLAPAVVGCAEAVRRFLAAGHGGAIVNVSSHQAQRAVRGALPYATAKAAVEGLTRAVAVDYGRHGIRANAVALGSIDTDRYRQHLDGLDAGAARRVEADMAVLHPLGRVGTAAEVAAVVAYLLSTDASFVSGAVVPVDGGRAARGGDPEER